MTNVLKLTKKIFTVGVVATTIVWSLGVAALVPGVANAATCPTLAAGDMVKVSGKPAIYVVDNNLKLRYFDNGDIFKSWRPTYGGYVTITMDCLDSLGIPSVAPYGISYHPGSYVVKRDSSDQLYVVLPNNTLSTITPAAAATLYGTGYKAMVISVQDWPNYPNRGVAITEAKAHEGMLVSNGGKTWYVDAGNVLREVTASGMTANGFQTRFVRPVADSVIAGYSTGSQITAEVKTMTDRTQSGGVVVNPAAGSVTVSLAASTPASTSVPQNGTRVPFTRLNLSAGSHAVTVDTLTVKRTGLSTKDDFSKVWVEKDGIRISSQASLNTDDEALVSLSPALTISAGQTVTLEIVASLSGSATGNGALGLATASAVSASGASVGGSYPLFGNLMSFVNYTVATYYIDDISTTRTVKVGDTSAIISQFDLGTTSTKDIVLKSIMLKNAGVEDLAKTLSNVYLQKGGETVSSNVTINGRYITFTLKDGGLLIEKSDSATLKVVADVVTKDYTTSPALQFSVNKAEDISVVEKNTGFGAALTNGTSVTLNDVVYTAGALTITKKATSPSDTDVIKGAKNVLALVANIKADEAMTADGLKLAATFGDGAGSFDNAKVTLNGLSLGSATPAASMTFDSTVNLRKGDNELMVYVDVNSNATSSATVQVSVPSTVFQGMSLQYANGNSVTDINGTPVGATITVTGADLSIVRNDGYNNDREIVKGASQTMLAKFNIKALYDNLKVTSIEVIPTASNTIASAAVTNMGVFVDGSIVGSVRSYTSSGATYNGLSYSLTKDVTRSMEVRADLDNTSTGTIQFTVTVNYEDSRSKSASDIGTSVRTVVVATGSVTVAADYSTRDTSNLVSKPGFEQELAIFKLTAVKDAANFTEISFDNNGVTDADFLISSYKLYKGTTLLGTENPTLGTTTFKLATDALVVAGNSNEYITLKAIFNDIPDAASTAKLFKPRLTTYKYKSSDSTLNTAPYSTSTYGNTMTLRKTVPVFSVLTPASDELLRFSVTADTNGDLVLTNLRFVATGSGAASTTDYKLYEGTTQRGTTQSNTTTPTFGSLTIGVSKGTTKIFSVKADTANVEVDKKVKLTLDTDVATNIMWQEVFVDGGNSTVNGANLYTLPISKETTF